MEGIPTDFTWERSIYLCVVTTQPVKAGVMFVGLRGVLSSLSKRCVQVQETNKFEQNLGLKREEFQEVVICHTGRFNINLLFVALTTTTFGLPCRKNEIFAYADQE